MELRKEDQLALVREIKSLIDSNKDNIQVLKHANELAKIAFRILENSKNSVNIGFKLQEYSYEILQVAEGKEDTTAWIEENNRAITEALKEN